VVKPPERERGGFFFLRKEKYYVSHPSPGGIALQAKGKESGNVLHQKE